MDQSLMNAMSTSSYYSPEQECHDPISIGTDHQGFHAGDVPEQRRRNEALAQPQPSSYPMTESHRPHYMAESARKTESQCAPPTLSGFVTGGSSVPRPSVTTPRSAISQLTQSFTQPHQIGQTNPLYLPIGFMRNLEDPLHSYSGWRPDPSVHRPITPSSMQSERYNYPGVSMPSHITYTSNSTTYSTSPRSTEPSLVQPYTPATSVFDPVDMPGTGTEQSHLFPFLNVECERQIQTASGDVVKPTIHAMATKGFFTAQGHWTCYRRNYFALNAWYDLGFMQHNTTLFLDGRPIKAFAMHLSATIEGQESKSVELVQYTPKRDAGLKTPIAFTRVAPSPPTGPSNMNTDSYTTMAPFQLTGNLGFPFLPLQNEIDFDAEDGPNSPSQCSSGSARGRFSRSAGQSQTDSSRHSFDRVQFKGATQNNGKRRASQQFYILVVELLVDVRDEDVKHAEWVRVACLPSDKLVVRGRSPSHYKESDGRTNDYTGRGGNHGRYLGRGQHGSPGGGQGGASTYSASTGNPGAFRPTYSYNHQNSISPASSYSTTSLSSNGDTISDVRHPMEPTMIRDDLAHMQSYPTYRYYPGTLFDGIPVLTKIESPTMVSLPGVASLAREDSKFAVEDEYQSTVGDRHWGPGALSSYMGFETSRGLYPDINGELDY